MYSVLRNSIATLVVTLSTRDYVESELRLGISAYRFYPFKSGILFTISYGMSPQMISIMLWVIPFLGVTCDYMWSTINTRYNVVVS